MQTNANTVKTVLVNRKPSERKVYKAYKQVRKQLRKVKQRQQWG